MMSRGPRLSSEVKKYIVSEALKTPQAPRHLLVSRLHAELSATIRHVPAEETIAKMVSKARNAETHADDRPWTMACVLEPDYSDHFASEAIPALLQVWRYAASTDEPFTIRQAKWVARLHKLHADTYDLWWWSRYYSEEEHYYWHIGEHFDTFAADSSMALSPWEVETLVTTGFHPPQGYTTRWMRLGPWPSGKHPAYEYDRLASHELSSPTCRTALLVFLTELPPLEAVGIDGATKMVYLRWLVTLTKGPKWAALSVEDASQLILDLRRWALEVEEEATNCGSWYPHRAQPIRCPVDLMPRVGYSVDDFMFEPDTDWLPEEPPEDFFEEDDKR